MYEARQRKEKVSRVIDGNKNKTIIQAMWMRYQKIRIKGLPGLLNSLTQSELVAIRNAVETGDLHRTNQAKGNIQQNAIGYIHSYTDNTLIQVRAINSINRTIVLLGDNGDRGHVNNGVHMF